MEKGAVGVREACSIQSGVLTAMASQVVKKPMDMLTIRSKLDTHSYKKVEPISVETSSSVADDVRAMDDGQVDKEFRADVLLMLDNAMNYNEEGDPIYEHAVSLKKLFEEEWKRLHLSVDALPPRVRTSHQPSEPEATPKQSSAARKSDAGPALSGWKEGARELLEWIVDLEEAEAFLDPVDPEALDIPDYFQVRLA